MILADTSGLLALLDEGESSHEPAHAVIAADPGPLLTIDLVLAEVDFLVRSRLGTKAGDAFLDQVRAGALQREPLTAADLARAAEILREYTDQAFGLTDASLMAVAERLSVPALTLNRRHFGVFRDQKGKGLRLLP